jgi:hypothetical protein
MLRHRIDVTEVLGHAALATCGALVVAALEPISNTRVAAQYHTTLSVRADSHLSHHGLALKATLALPTRSRRRH